MRRCVVTLVAACCLATASAAPAAAAPPDAPTLGTDATGPLFTATRMNGGVTQERCLVLSWSDAADQVLGLSVPASGDLLGYLDVQVATGSGGGFADCSGFRLETVAFAGTLAVLASEHPAPAEQLRLHTTATAAGSVTVRIRVTASSMGAAQGRSAVADLTFAAVPVAGDPTQDPTPDPTADPTSGPGGTDEQDGGQPSDPDPAEPEGPAEPEPTAGPQVPAPVDTPTPESGTEGMVTVPMSPDDPSTPAPGGVFAPVVEALTAAREAVAEAITAAGETITEASGPVASGLRWTFWSLPPLLLFLLVQNRIDRRDPKLAHAPAAALPTLPFDDGYDDEHLEP